MTTDRGTDSGAPTEPTDVPDAPSPAATDPAALAAAIRALSAKSPSPEGAGAAGGGSAPEGEGPAAADAAQEEALRAAAEVLTGGGAPAALAPAALSVLGERAAEALREDPWSVLALPGVRPEQADGFARGLLGDGGELPGDPRRAQALTVHLLERAALHGDTAAELAAVQTGLEKLGVPAPEEALAAVLGEGRVMAFQEEDANAVRSFNPDAEEEDEEEPAVRVLLALDRYALAEESLADGLVRLISTFEQPLEAGAEAESSGQAAEAGAGAEAGAEDAATAESVADESVADEVTAPDALAPDAAAWEGAAAAAPSPSAADLIHAAARSGLTLHTGGEEARAEPLALVRAARALGLRAWLAVATEDGVRRLGGEGSADTAADTADSPVVTLSDLLSGARGPGRRAEDGALALDLLAVCDAPRLDVESAATLAESLPDGVRLVLSGDPGELWSAGPGRVFADLLAAKPCPVVASRTPDPGPLGELVSGIGIGELLPVEAPDKEVVIVAVGDPGEAVHRTVQLVHDSIPRALGIPAEQVRVLTPGHGGPVGTRALNAALKARCNPGPGRFGGFDPGDAAVYSPAAGDTRPATVLSADAAGLQLEAPDGARFTVPRAQVEAGKVRHGWALTVHQSVGRRWPAVVTVLPGDAATGLTRQLLYTAFGRAERHLSVVQGAGPALADAVTNRPAHPRVTRLRGILAH